MFHFNAIRKQIRDNSNPINATKTVCKNKKIWLKFILIKKLNFNVLNNISYTLSFVMILESIAHVFNKKLFWKSAVLWFLFSGKSISKFIKEWKEIKMKIKWNVWTCSKAGKGGNEGNCYSWLTKAKTHTKREVKNWIVVVLFFFEDLGENEFFLS